LLAFKNLQICDLFAEKAMIFNTGKGSRLQDLEGHIYQTIGNLSPGVVYWRCQFARRCGTKCKAKIKTVGDGWIVSKSGVHNHRKSRTTQPPTSVSANPEIFGVDHEYPSDI
jgi:hypothetical protein